MLIRNEIASGDLRNVIDTILNIPEGGNQKICIYLNDKESDIIVRNLIIILLATYFPNGEASEMITHFWYSSALTPHMMATMKEMLAPIVREFCKDLETPSPDFKGVIISEWDVGESDTTVRVLFPEKIWRRLLAVVEGDCPCDFEAAEKSRREINVNPASQHTRDEQDRINFLAPPSRRLTDNKFRERGIMLPFGTPAESFIVPNP